MRYTARYLVDGGVSHGFGLNYPAKYTAEQTFEFEDIDEESDYFGEKLVVAKAIIEGYGLCRNVLSNPKTGKSKVILLEIKDKNGNSLDQKVFLEEHVSGFRIGNLTIQYNLQEGQVVLEDNWLYKLLRGRM